MNDRAPPSRPMYDRALLLHGLKRDQILTLDEIRQYGTDSFSDPDYLSIYGLKPAEWYARGIRLLGRTAVECTRDVLADRIGRDMAALAAAAPAGSASLVVDPFAGSGITPYWPARHLRPRRAVGFERHPRIFDTTRPNLAL